MQHPSGEIYNTLICVPGKPDTTPSSAVTTKKYYAKSWKGKEENNTTRRMLSSKKWKRKRKLKDHLTNNHASTFHKNFSRAFIAQRAYV